MERAIRTDQTLEEASFHLLSSGGKRVRPVFVILSSQFGTSEGTSEDTYRVAVALELIHMATSSMMMLLIRVTSVEDVLQFLKMGSNHCYINRKLPTCIRSSTSI